eukprot:SAG31_NODE_1258_length_9078_cov_12.076512_3_plen_343_part_00
MRVAVVGVGGIGGWIGAHLAHVGTNDVVFIGRAGSAHTAAMEADGLRLIEPDGEIFLPSIRVVVPGTARFAETAGACDVLIVCVKTFQVRDAVRSALPLLRATGTIFTTQNGVDAPAIAAAAVGAGRVVASVCRVAAMIERPGVVAKSSAFTGGSLEFGDFDYGGNADGGTGRTQRIDTLCALFREAGISATASPDIKKAMWTKLASISAFGAVGAVARAYAPVEVLCAVEPCRKLVAAAMDEALQVATAEGVAVDLGFTDLYMDTAKSSPRGTTVSTIRDILGGNKSELFELSGAVVAHGTATGTPTPTQSFCVSALAAMEGKARGEVAKYTMKGVERARI